MMKLTPSFILVAIFCLSIYVDPVHSWFFKRSGSSSGSSSSRSRGAHKYDIKTKSGLTKLYNKEVVKIERVERPMGVPGDIAKHQGVKVTTKDGGSWLIHKGNNYGSKKEGDNIVVNAKHMDKTTWETVRSNPVKTDTSIGDLVKAGGADAYNLFSDNCYDAASKMEKKAGGGNAHLH